MKAGHRSLHQKGIRQEIQPNLALHRGQKFRILCDARDQELHLLLYGINRHFTLQIRLTL
jgi:hypothetical protein